MRKIPGIVIGVSLCLAFVLQGCGEKERNASLNLSDIRDLDGKDVAVAVGTVHDRHLSAHYPEIAIKHLESNLDLGLAVKTGQATAALLDYYLARKIVENNPELDILQKDVFAEEMGMIFNRDDHVLPEQFNAFLKEIQRNGVYDEILDRWLDGTKDTRLPDLPENGGNGVLRIGVTGIIEPFNFIQDRELVGIDIELAKRFAAFIGRKPEMSAMTFTGLLSATSSGKVDMACSGITINEERKKMLAFSEPYFKSGAALIALKKNMAAHAGEETEVRRQGFLQSVKTSLVSNLIEENRYLIILDGLKITCMISILAGLLGTLLGGVFCAARMSGNALLRTGTNTVTFLLKGTPVVVLLMIAYYVIFASVEVDPITVAVVAFGANFGACVSEMFHSAVRSVGKGQVEAGIAMGFTPFRAFLYITLPQAIRHVLPLYKDGFNSMVKMTSVVGYVAVQDLTKAGDIIRSRTFDAFFPLILVAVLYFVLAYTLTFFLELISRKFNYKRI